MYLTLLLLLLLLFAKVALHTKVLENSGTLLGRNVERLQNNFVQPITPELFPFPSRRLEDERNCSVTL